MRVVHPQSRDDVDGNCPGAVTLGGESYDCGDGDAFDAPRPAARELAGLYGVDVETIAVGEETDAAPSDGDESDTCEVVKADGEVCGRDRPCPYHDD